NVWAFGETVQMDDKCSGSAAPKTKKSLQPGPPHIYRAPAAPWDFQPQGSFVSKLPSWRSLELHKHHRALGLAAAPSGTRGGADIATMRPVQPVTLLRPHAA